MINPVITLAAIALAGAALMASPVAAQVKLPPTITMTAYDTGTSGFNITVAIGKMLKDKYGSDSRVLPAGNDVARLQPLRANRACDLGHGRRRLSSRRKACSNSPPGNGGRSRSRSR